jgi:hypothetical protein
MHSTLFNGAISNLAKDIAATPWEISGGPQNSRYFQHLLLSSDFGGGWRNLILKIIRDYSVLDRGAFVELVGGGKPNQPIRGRVTGVHSLDPLRCIPTGDPIYPVVYHSVRGIDPKGDSYHLLHHTRVYRFIDMPSTDERLFDNGMANLGFCALSRYFGYYYAEMLMGRYNIERLEDQPPLGFITSSGVQDLSAIMARFEADRRAEGQTVFRNLIQVQGYNPSDPPQINIIPFSQLPEGMDQKSAIEMNARLVALAIGVDPQDVMPLTGQAIGTGAQSKVLDSKARGKTKGDLLKIIERFINIAVLPSGMEFKFTEPDDERAKVSADRAAVWVQVANELPTTTEARLRLLANTVPEIADVVIDDEGNIVLPDGS